MNPVDSSRSQAQAARGVGAARTAEPRKLRERRASWLAVPPPRALLADDDVEVRRLVHAALRMDGFGVIEVCDGAELADDLCAVLLSGEPAPIDVVVSDIRMPGLSGLEVLAGVRGLDMKTPMLLITAYADATTRAEAHRLGAYAFMEKPFDIDELRSAVQSAVRGPQPRMDRGPAGPRGGAAGARPGEGVPVACDPGASDVLLVGRHGALFRAFLRRHFPARRVLDAGQALAELYAGLRPRLVVLDRTARDDDTLDLLAVLDSREFAETAVVILSDEDEPAHHAASRLAVQRPETSELFRAVAELDSARPR
jgi:DNA-binding response OmpR family regulator